MKAAVAFFGAVTCAAVLVSANPQQQTVRDGGARLAAGTAVFTGVITAAENAKPIRGAIVTLNHVDRTYGDTSITDDEGRFTFSRVPAGRYLIAASKQGFIRTSFGASKPERSGTPVAIAEGQQLAISLRLVHGAALTGRVLDSDGEPSEGVEIVLKRVVATGGERRLIEVYGTGSQRTDDRGIYRLYGLPAGDYVIKATPDLGHDIVGFQSTTPADVSWAKQQLQSTATDRPAASSPPGRAMFNAAPVYYPNALQQSAAAVVTLGAGEERDGLDITLRIQPTFRLEGVVIGPDGRSPQETPSIYLAEKSQDESGFEDVRPTAGATFLYTGLPAGQYTIAAVLERSRLWATQPVSIGSSNATIRLTLQSALTVSGTVVFRGAHSAPVDLTQTRISLTSLGTSGPVTITPAAATMTADGKFTAAGLMPGLYRLVATWPAAPASDGATWTLRSAIAGNQDIADVPLDLRAAADVANVVVAFTDRLTQLEGRLQDASGRPAADYFIIVFPTDERAWLERARRIVQTRPGNDGHYTVRGLPPGDYYVAALTDVERNEWFDAGFLRQLVPTSTKISLAEGEQKTQDWRIGG